MCTEKIWFTIVQSSQGYPTQNCVHSQPWLLRAVDPSDAVRAMAVEFLSFFQSLRVNPRLSRKSRWPGEEYPTKSQRSPKCEISGAWSEELQSLNPEILWSSLFSFVNSDMKADFQQVCLPWSSCASGCVEVRRTAWAPVPLCGNGSRGLGYLISWRGNRWDLVVGQYLEKRAWCEGRLENDIHVWYLSGWQYNTKIWYYAIYIYICKSYRIRVDSFWWQ